MAKFVIRFDDPETGNRKEVIEEFSDWTGHAIDGVTGEEVGPAMTVTALEWAQDAGYSYADKGWFTVTPVAD